MGLTALSGWNHLPEVIARLPGALDAVLSAGAERTAAYARANHPWENRTGETEGSIHVEAAGPHRFQVVAGGASLFLEFGTVHMPPYPFLLPAFLATQGSMDEGYAKLEAALTR